ncbi:MAG TPA: hypothetical protein VGQ57_19590 [Polyangiaceae bacterium]|nr:hypothetical protein [Polyangiaceae bacterium]
MPCARWLVALVVLGASAWTPRAEAADYRRPGLEGAWNERHLTTPMNSLRLIAGPGQPVLLGDRVSDQIVEGGAQFIRSDAAGRVGDQWWFRGGVDFGLTEDWEAGAMFLPVKFAPDLELANVTAFVTRGFRFEAWDFGLRLSFLTPGFRAYNLKAWALNPGVPVLVRAGPARIDAGVFVPITTSDGGVGLNAPVRATVNLGPRFFLGVETGFFEQRFDGSSKATLPLGALAGYTDLFRNKVADITADFAWDDFYQPAPSAGRDAFELKRYRVGLGLVVHLLVR